MFSPYQTAVTAQGVYDSKLSANALQNRQQVIAVIRRFGDIAGNNVVGTAKLGDLIQSFDAASFASALSAFTNTTIGANEVDATMSIDNAINLVGRKEIERDLADEEPEQPEEPEGVTGADVMAAIKTFSGSTATGTTNGTIDLYRGTKTLTEVIGALNTEYSITLDATTDNITLNTNMDQLVTLINAKIAG